MLSSFRKFALPFALLLVMAVANSLVAQKLVAQKVLQPEPQQGEKLVPDGTGNSVLVPDNDSKQKVRGPNGINYHGGPVLQGNPVPIYLIWYGTWTNVTGSDTMATVNLVEHYVNSLGNTPYEKINSTYTDTTGSVSGNVTLGGAIFDTGSQGTGLNNTALSAIVTRSFSNGLPTDPNGVYLVLTSSNVSEQGFCSSFCGFHTHQTLNGTDIKWGFIGNPDRCPSGCEIQTTGPNSPATGVGGADGLINVLTHEQEEAISDPDLNAWFDKRGEENADKCNFNFGATQKCSSGSLCSAAGNSAGAQFNQSFGNNNWMIQQNWENANGGGCVQHFP